MDTHIFEKILRPIIYIMLNNVDKIVGDLVHHNRMGRKTCTVSDEKFLNWFFFVMGFRVITRFVHSSTKGVLIMHQRVAAINDLSGLGRCSLTADIAILAAMGFEACPLPTAVLTTQTGYPGYRCVSFTEHMDDYRQHWQQLGVAFQGILSGYLATPEAAEQVEAFLDTFQKPDTLYLCDPVLGDDGHVYRGFTDASIEAMRKLALRADLLTPNLTEFCILTGTDMDPLFQLGRQDPEALFQELTRLAGLYKGKRLVITGIPHPSSSGEHLVTNLVIDGGNAIPVTFPHLGGTYSGTGDLFAAILLGSQLQQRTLVQGARLAGELIGKAIRSSKTEGTPCNDGVNYEPYLSLLGKE